MIRLHLFKEVKVKLPLKRIQELFENVVTEEADSDYGGRINIVLSGDSHIRKLNKDYRLKDKSTDVLSFNVEQPANENAVFGEIYVSVPIARRQAVEYRHTFSDELLRLICHGLLHLFGYDHIRSKDRTKMEARERYFLKDVVSANL
jgi:probable rRNA maturation factor